MTLEVLGVLGPSRISPMDSGSLFEGVKEFLVCVYWLFSGKTCFCYLRKNEHIYVFVSLDIIMNTLITLFRKHDADLTRSTAHALSTGHTKLCLSPFTRIPVSMYTQT